MHTAETRQRDLDKRRQRRESWLLENGPCKCGSWKDLEVDHIDPNQKISHRVWSWSDSRRIEELSKCQVLCKVCHRAKTNLSLMKNEHGLSRYRHHGCRCTVCREAKRESRLLSLVPPNLGR